MQYVESLGEETIRVLVADDTRIHTQLLAEALRHDRQLEVVSSPAHSSDLVEAAILHKVDVGVISVNLEEEALRGCEVLRELRARLSGFRAIMLLDSSKKESVLHAFGAGARGIFSRQESVDTLSKCIRRVHQGQIWADSQQMSVVVEALAGAPAVRAVDANGLSLLSKRELDVVRCLTEGLTNREIAERLGLSQHTIKNYLFRVFDKLGVSSRLELLFMTLTQTGAPQQQGPQIPFDQPLNRNGGRRRRASLSRPDDGTGAGEASIGASETDAAARSGDAEHRDRRMRVAPAPELARASKKDQRSEKPIQGIATAVGRDPGR